MQTSNPDGRNQHRSKVEAGPELKAILQGLVDRGISGHEDILDHIAAHHPKYSMQPSTLRKYMKKLNIVTARKKNWEGSAENAIGAVHSEMSLDPARNRGPGYVHHELKRKGVHLPRNLVEGVMRGADPEGFDHRNPKLHAKEPKHTGQVVVEGPHHKWATDGHEKTKGIGFPVYGIRDYWGRIHGYWIVPNDRDEFIVEYLYLLVVQQFGGIPRCVTTDKGPETGRIYARQRSLRSIFGVHLPEDLWPSFLYLYSVDNIVIERSWRPVWAKEGQNMVIHWNSGLLEAGYDKHVWLHRMLADWVWLPVLQASLQGYVDHHNDYKTRFQKDKIGPSGCSPNQAMLNPAKYGPGGTNCLIPVSKDLIDSLVENHVGKERMKFWPDWFGDLVRPIYEQLGRPVVNVHTAWNVWRALLIPVAESVPGAFNENPIWIERNGD